MTRISFLRRMSGALLLSIAILTAFTVGRERRHPACSRRR